MGKLSLTVIILTLNEERHIERAIRSVEAFACSIFVVDAGSKDSTCDIAKRLGAVVTEHPWRNYADQFQWALENMPTRTNWVMRLDADEIIEPELAREVCQKLEALPLDISGIYLNRKHVFMGRWIRFGGRFPLTLLRIWRTGHARIEQRWMDEHIVLIHGSAVTFENTFADCNLNDLSYFIEKHNKYATREAIDVLVRRYELLDEDDQLLAPSNKGQASRKRVLKERVFNKLPFEVSTTLYFFFRYFIQLGFLDGRPGAIYHFLQGYWYRFLVGAKVAELDHAIGRLPKNQAVKLLATLTGLKVG
ncbi:spsA [Bradyrhizobium sp. CCBAU 45321]|uniref:glycosyltransferase family 2 protein n=1 Tax=Bradyrhizobium sp. CCBAU 45321 TaxID=1641878 RepID=UPI0023024BDB|nr:glycosyltransferase family 2 protein [Bradyrhizobium sp. CCBAU 45321]MDA9543901.1 spsA [Bradyrhizobium sp. CCBAU 45321]